MLQPFLQNRSCRVSGSDTGTKTKTKAENKNERSG